MLKRRYRINLVKQFEHEGVGRWLAIKGHRQAGPNDQRDIVDGIVAHERVVAWHLAAVEIHMVRSKRHQRYAIPIPLALRCTRILRFRAVEPLALIGGPGIFGDGGDATAVTSQHADSSNIQLGDNHFPWGGGYDYGPDLNVNASPITQVADTTAVGGLGLFGDGGDALAFTNQDADIFNVQG
jgi:hypothetical protein